jgi:hypothetical protein
VGDGREQRQRHGRVAAFGRALDGGDPAGHGSRPARGGRARVEGRAGPPWKLESFTGSPFVAPLLAQKLPGEQTFHAGAQELRAPCLAGRLRHRRSGRAAPTS